jgi:replicative DNA helicase
MKIRFRRSELVLVAAQPATGKSAFALDLAVKTGVPTLYVSVDSSAHTQALRVLAMLTGQPQDNIEPQMKDHPQWVEETVRRTGHIRWCFDSSPTLDTIEDELSAFITLYGEPPHLLIIDNATDIDASAADEWATLRALMRVMKDWARTMDMCVMALHHTSESEEYKKKGMGPCPPRSAIQGKVSQIPAMVVTLHAPEGELLVAPVKNRHGKADYTGATYATLSFYGDTMQIVDPLASRAPMPVSA